jgi:1-acyl-sn-glycerol-3-phosphate acyltransferase
MSAVRSILFAVFQFVLTPVYAVLVLLLFWLPPLGRYRFIMGWCALMLLGARWICGIRMRVIGRENIRQTPQVVMCKHSSTWETLAINFILPPLAFVAKKELLSIPFFGWAFALASPITIDRRAGRDAMQQMVEQGRARFGQGFWIVVYPEGTRIRVGDHAKYKTGGARLASALGVPILPIAHNAGYLWPRGTMGKRSGTVTVSIGPAIDPSSGDVGEVTAAVERWVEAEVARLGAPSDLR